MNNISVLGIFVADIVFSGNKIPMIGETILGNRYKVGPGGKGCNQAISISRMGGKVDFITKIGNDDYGKLALATFRKNNISLSNIIISDHHPTGVAGILVDENSGRNAINVIVGAAKTLKIDEVNIEVIKKSKIFFNTIRNFKRSHTTLFKSCKRKKYYNYT